MAQLLVESRDRGPETCLLALGIQLLVLAPGHPGVRNRILGPQETQVPHGAPRAQHRPGNDRRVFGWNRVTVSHVCRVPAVGNPLELSLRNPP